MEKPGANGTRDPTNVLTCTMWRNSFSLRGYGYSRIHVTVTENSLPPRKKRNHFLLVTPPYLWYSVGVVEGANLDISQVRFYKRTLGSFYAVNIFVK